MAINNQNLFEKYGIKEVADVTFYRIEKKEETYESQREITVASILKGAIELKTVYPIVDGVGSEEGFKAYVSSNADVLTRTNYDCDDSNDIIGNYRITYLDTENREADVVETAVEGLASDIINYFLKGQSLSENIKTATVLSYIDEGSGVELSANKVKNYESFVIKTKEGSVPDVTAILVQTPETITDTVEGSFTVSTNIEGTAVSIVPASGYSLVSTTASSEGTVNRTAIDTYTINQAGPVTFTIEFKNNLDATQTKTKVVSIEIEETETAGVFTFEPQTVSDNFVIPVGKQYVFNMNIVFTGSSSELNTGANAPGSLSPDPLIDGPGTHEYSYEQQICMLFARKQNLITKTGSRYQFTGVTDIFGDLTFNDDFTLTPFSTEKAVVLGLAGKFTEGTYDVEEIEEYIKQLSTIYVAKAYDVVYEDYAELVVEDEMGFFRPDFLGYSFTKNSTTSESTVDFFTTTNTYASHFDIIDAAINNAKMWEDGVHYSINDAIDALRQKQLVLDVNERVGSKGPKSIFGGYTVSSKETTTSYTPEPGQEDTDVNSNKYTYNYHGATGNEQSKYPLEDVENALANISANTVSAGQDIRVDYSGKRSNRAIYVRVDAGAAGLGAYIYLLHNKNYRRLATDKEGIFQFEDKKGNTLYYQDKIFKGVEYLALVILGDKGLIFVVNRHGDTNINRLAWMINDNGYVDNKKAAILVKNGLIHTTDITVNDETFEATCSVKSLTVKKIAKKTNHYIPVLFLDTLKISTIEQTAETTYATGGRGNANLIGWDFGKEITLNLQDALFTPASMSAIFGSYEGNDFRKGVKEVKSLDRFEKVTAKRSFIVPAGNSNGTPTEADKTAQAVFYDPNTMEPYADGTPIAEGEVFYKFTRSVAYEGQSLGHMIEISADKFPGTYKVVGDTFVRSKETGEDERFQFVIPQAKMTSEQTITLEADGDPAVNIFLNAAVKIA